MTRRNIFITCLLLLYLALVSALPVAAQSSATPSPQTTATPATAPIDLTKAATAGSLPVQIIVLLTLLSFIPAILISMTCFTRLIVVFHFLRQALGTQ
jgi:flagellar biosynthetic protein FliP